MSKHQACPDSIPPLERPRNGEEGKRRVGKHFVPKMFEGCRAPVPLMVVLRNQTGIDTSDGSASHDSQIIQMGS
jgi:hypothetical protein